MEFYPGFCLHCIFSDAFWTQGLLRSIYTWGLNVCWCLSSIPVHLDVFFTVKMGLFAVLIASHWHTLQNSGDICGCFFQGKMEALVWRKQPGQLRLGLRMSMPGMSVSVFFSLCSLVSLWTLYTWGLEGAKSFTSANRPWHKSCGYGRIACNGGSIICESLRSKK